MKTKKNIFVLTSTFHPWVGDTNPSVLFVTRSYPPSVGGMETLSYNLTTRYLNKKKIIALKMAGKINLIWFIPYSLIMTLFYINRYDILHLSDGVMCFVGFIIKSLFRNKKVVTNLHGLDLTYSNKIYQSYISFCLKKFDLYICNSETTKQIAINKGLDKKKCVVIPVGVENKFNNTISKTEAREILLKKYGIKDNTCILLTTGRLVKRKGVYWFIKNVISKIQGVNFTYLVIGDGSEKDRIKKIIHRKKLGNNIILAGKVSEKDLIYCYKGSDIFIMPNITVKNDVEGFGIVAIEASMSGLPVIASCVQGISDAVLDELNGYLVREKDVNGFIYKITTLAKDRNLILKTGKKFSKFTKKKYNWESIIKKYTIEFEQLNKYENKKQLI